MSTSPLLGIRMCSVLPPSQVDGVSREELFGRLNALITQEKRYKCEDYLCRQIKEDEQCGTEEREEKSSEANSVDASCREKMCEWSYRVVDHFKVPRNIVAVAFSFLDRFVNTCSCDRTAFKLASMTALYMATKLFNGRQLSIATLAELSRGEFDISHIAEMETIMLKTLEWRLNPPIVQDLVQYFLALFPASFPYSELIGRRAFFFAELCVYDYDHILTERGVLAIASIFNAIDAVLVSVDEPHLASELENSLLNAIHVQYPSCCTEKGVDQNQEPSALVQSTQRRLWYLYSCSAQASQENAVERSQPKDKRRRKVNADHGAPKSPTSVHQVASISPSSIASNKSLF